MVGTIFGKPVGKFALGTESGGIERSLLGKFIGETPIYSYPGGSVQLPERVAVGTSPLGWILIGAVLSYVLTRPKKGFLERLLG